MIGRVFQRAALCGLMGLMPLGCMSNMDMDAMKQPQRPRELDRLNTMVGDWETTAEIQACGNEEESMKSSGKSSANWDCEGWCLVERGQFDMGEMGKINGVSVWSWDAKAKKYRTVWTDSFGDTDYGTARYDDDTKTWHMKGKSRGSLGTSRTSGTMKMVDDKTMEWTYTERYGPFGMFKGMDMKGTSKKK